MHSWCIKFIRLNDLIVLLQLNIMDDNYLSKRMSSKEGKHPHPHTHIYTSFVCCVGECETRKTLLNDRYKSCEPVWRTDPISKTIPIQFIRCIRIEILNYYTSVLFMNCILIMDIASSVYFHCQHLIPLRIIVFNFVLFFELLNAFPSFRNLFMKNICYRIAMHLLSTKLVH